MPGWRESCHIFVLTTLSQNKDMPSLSWSVGFSVNILYPTHKTIQTKSDGFSLTFPEIFA